MSNTSLFSDLNTFTPTSKALLFDLEAVYQSIMTILDTRVGELWFDKLEFGSVIEETLFELGDAATIQQLLDDTIDSIEDNEPRVKIDIGNTTIDFDKDKNSVLIKLVFTINGFGAEKFQLVKPISGV